MASIIDCFNETLSENLAFVKFVVFAIPVYFIANLFIVGNTKPFDFWVVVAGILFIGLLAQGIHNVRMNRNEILTFNIKDLGIAIFRSLVVLIPVGLVFYNIGKIILTSIKLPAGLPHVQLIVNIIVWAIVGSVVLTSFLSFAKYLKIKEGFNFRLIFDSCIDVVFGVLFFIPQLVIANAILVGPVWWVFTFFNIPIDHWGFIAYCSVLFVINWSVLAYFFAELSFKHIKGSNEEYNENVQINVIDDITSRMN